MTCFPRALHMPVRMLIRQLCCSCSDVCWGGRMKLPRMCRVHPECLIGCDGFVSAFVLAVATQQTIGASV